VVHFPRLCFIIQAKLTTGLEYLKLS